MGLCKRVGITNVDIYISIINQQKGKWINFSQIIFIKWDDFQLFKQKILQQYFLKIIKINDIIFIIN